MLKKINWQAYTNENRNEIIETIKEAILKNSGYIINFNRFSDLALSLSIEVEENKISELHLALAQIINISDFDTEKINKRSTKEWMIFLNISFSKGKGDLKIEIPQVPG